VLLGEFAQGAGLHRWLEREMPKPGLSLIIAAVIIGSSLNMAVHSGPHYLGIPLQGLIGYSVASALGLWWVTAILRSGSSEQATCWLLVDPCARW
jgi:ubiquinone biosynthesis protein